MKHLLTTLLLIISIHTTHAQFGENHAIYTTLGLDVGNYFGASFGLNYVYQENYSLRLEHTVRARSSATKPEDFRVGLFRAFSFGLANPYDRIENYQIMAGKIYKLNTKGTIRLNMSIGIGYTRISEPENWQMIDSFLFSDNYTWDTYGYKTLSFIISPKIEFPFARHYGLTLSPMVQINKGRTYVGIGIEHMIGLLRKRPK